MSNRRDYLKETETQATSSPVPEEFDSPIAPQGYAPDLVEDIADMETPQQKRGKAIRYLIWTVLLIIATIFFCLPRNAELPSDVPIPYNLEARPLPAANLFLYQIAPKTLGDFRQVHQDVARSYEEAFLGAVIATSTYVNDQGQVVTVSIINAGSYINANRYLRNLKTYLEEDVKASHMVERIWLENSFLEWEAPQMGNQAYGFAWSNQNFYYSVLSANQAERDFFVENFPY
jgi:hypothetical protein